MKTAERTVNNECQALLLNLQTCHMCQALTTEAREVSNDSGTWVKAGAGGRLARVEGVRLTRRSMRRQLQPLAGSR